MTKYSVRVSSLDVRVGRAACDDGIARANLDPHQGERNMSHGARVSIEYCSQ